MMKDEDLEGELEELEEVEEEEDAGIFDEDLEGELEELEDVLEDDSNEVSDFFIGDTILSSGNGEESWSKEDLEEVLRNERIERDWQDSEEFVGGDFYNAGSGGDFYGTSNNTRDGFYETAHGEDLYKGESGGNVYNTGDVYAGKTNTDGTYEAGAGGMKSYDEVVEGRRDKNKSSVLETMGFESGKKDKRRDYRDYETRK